jgi:N-formylglutamate amidohydrolase
LLVDPERFVEDAEEPMAEVGQGVIYTRTIIEANRRGGFTVEENRSYAGTIVPMDYQRDQGVRSIMIEVCRDLYMDEGSGLKSDGFARMRSEVGRILREIQ